MKCKDCKDSISPDLKCKTSKEQVKISQFQQTGTPYKKFDKTLGKEIEKISWKPKKVQLEMLYEELVKKVWKMWNQYLVYKYEVFNGMHHCPVILSTTSEMGLIYHMDISENISQMCKFEPQSSHFNKAQYSLHCTVRHGANGNLYLYHLSDEKWRDYAFTAAVDGHIISIEKENHDILRFKS